MRMASLIPWPERSWSTWKRSTESPVLLEMWTTGSMRQQTNMWLVTRYIFMICTSILYHHYMFFLPSAKLIWYTCKISLVSFRSHLNMILLQPSNHVGSCEAYFCWYLGWFVATLSDVTVKMGGTIHSCLDKTNSKLSHRQTATNCNSSLIWNTMLW